MDDNKELDLTPETAEAEEPVTETEETVAEAAETTEEIAESADAPKKGILGKLKKESDESNFKTDVQSVMEKTDSYTKDDLNAELEKLAETFRAELKKAAEQGTEISSEAYELIQQLDEDEGTRIDPEDLCQCCGEKRRDKSVREDYEYCAECREAMRRYPFGIQHFFIAAAVLVAAVFSVVLFVQDYSGYKNVKDARAYLSQNKRTSADANYTAAISYFEENSIGCKKLYLETAKNEFALLPDGANSLSNVADTVEKGLSKLEASLPLYSNYIELRKTSLTMYATLQEFYAIVNDDAYAEFDGTDDAMYQEIIGKLEELLEKETLIQVFGESSSNEQVPCDEGIIRFAEYMLAYTCQKYDDSYTYIKLLEEAKPTYVSLYAYELAMIETQKGNLSEASDLIKLLKLNNAEETGAYTIEAFLTRMKGDYDKALTICDDGLAISSEDPDLYRQKAMAYIAQGEYKKACEECKTGLDISEYGALYYVYLVAATELNDVDLVDEINASIEELGVEYTERMQKYIDGKLTAKQLFTEGTGDVE